MSDPKDLTDEELKNAWVEAYDQRKDMAKKRSAAIAEAKTNANFSSLDRPVTARDHYLALCLRLAWERHCAQRQKQLDEGIPPKQLKVMDDDELFLHAELLMLRVVQCHSLIEWTPPLLGVETQWEEAARREWLLRAERERREKGQP